MKRATFFAAAMLLGAAVAVSPLQAAAAPLQIQAYSLKDYLKDCQWDDIKVITIPCLPGDLEDILGKPCLPDNQPETNIPETPDTEAPETPDVNIPETPDTDTPETPDVNIPETPDTNIPETPETNIPETPETNQPETDQPGEDDLEQSVHAYVLRVVELVNEERAKAGLNALTLQENITEAAQVRAVESEISFSHTRPNGTSFSTALKEAGVSYRGAGENIAWGQKSPEQVMEAWMKSDGHRANILNEKYTSIGVGYYQNAAGVNYWSQLFTY